MLDSLHFGTHTVKCDMQVECNIFHWQYIPCSTNHFLFYTIWLERISASNISSKHILLRLTRTHWSSFHFDKMSSRINIACSSCFIYVYIIKQAGEFRRCTVYAGLNYIIPQYCNLHLTNWWIILNVSLGLLQSM